MIKNDVILKDKDRFLKPYTIDRAKLEKYAQLATEKLLVLDKKFGTNFPKAFPKEEGEKFRYDSKEDITWVSGLYTGMFWLAYEMSGQQVYRDIAEKHLPAYKKNIDEKLKVHDHDVGFMYSPSVVAAYKVTGSELAREIGLDTAKFFYDHSWNKEGKFIMRGYRYRERGGNRTMMDALFNAPFLLWAGKETGNQDYFNAGYEQNLTTAKYLIREDGSCYHHYAFDIETNQPERGLTLQGFSDESTWSRGHAWGIYGFPVCYAYTKDERLIDVHKNVTYYMLNHLPENLLPCWDYIFPEPNTEPRDSSTAVIASCGLHEMAKYLPEGEQKQIYQNAAAMLLEAVIDNCVAGENADGLIDKVTGALPQGIGIEECAVYGDYFYLEAIMRQLNPDWNMYW